MEYIIAVITAVVNAYLEREKAQQDEERSMRVIREMNEYVTNNGQKILDALFDLKINELIGLYLGQIENFKEYEPTDDMKSTLEKLAYDINLHIVGPLINLFDTHKNNISRVRKIVHLLVLTISLRALVLSELKFRHGDDRDEHLLEQWKYASGCAKWVIDNQLEHHFNPTFRIWNICEENFRTDTTCLPTGETDPWRTPSTCCIPEFKEYKPERDNLQKDKEQGYKIDEAINYLEGFYLLKKWEIIKVNEKPTH
ncbi:MULTISPECIES: hypothetical protein [Paenibacillus]|uniref:Uncharacterized protein n=1 Tax=Paenibacillus borealis TaxID=160799 RepID=A0ABX3GV50_PAEBO|nr:hypothetical protein [Paenibacillus borealis]OMD35367.1 hypothetical protein BSK56_33025 [Paenibacillus borealis]